MEFNPSPENESFAHGLLEYPQYTRPREWQSDDVPEVLMGGNHAEIEKFRHLLSILRTAQLRPDLLKNAKLSAKELKAASDFLNRLSKKDQELCGLKDPELIEKNMKELL